MKTMFVKPNNGVKIRMPDKPNETLPEKGDTVPWNSFWMRRWRESSVSAPELEKARKAAADKKAAAGKKTAAAAEKEK